MSSAGEIPYASIKPPNRGELLLELLSEEIPAGMQARAIGFLVGIIRQRLLSEDIPAAEPIESYITPRRMVVIARGIPDKQPDRTEERRGPRVGAPQSAVAGFLRSTGLSSTAELEEWELPGGKFYVAVLAHRGRPASEVLPDLIRGAMTGVPWPKSMRYPASSLRWVRPLTSVLCLFDGEILRLTLDQVAVGRTTQGHRFLSPGEICVGNAGEYLERLHKAHVVLDQDRRKGMIQEELQEAAATKGLLLNPDPNLLEEVTGLVEYPVVLMGSVDSDFMTLPREVLATTMRVHQKYFSSRYPDGTPAPHFLFVANNRATDGGKTIVAGNERVLRARLTDARFFWDQDRRVPLESRLDSLKGRVFHEKLGSMYDKAERIAALAEFLAPRVSGADPQRARRAAWLAKADLSTGMVGEFPELQGTMGSYYYEQEQHSGEPREILAHKQIATAIGDHYRPLGPSDHCPSAPESIVVALADKIDSLVAFFAIGGRPTGSGDPFALRRAAQGIIRIILENKLRLPLARVFSYSRVLVSQIGSASEGEGESILDELLSFIGDRLKVHLREQGVRHDLIGAAFAKIREDNGDLIRLLSRVGALRAFLETEDGASLLIAYRRAANIVSIEERRDHCSYDDEPDWTHFLEPAEKTLARALPEIGGVVGEAVIRGQFDEAMSRLATLHRPVDEFFDKVTVNTDVPELRENRLHLLSRIRATMNQVADFSQIEG
jgi:glycyl-tRNA synthetase beta chain